MIFKYVISGFLVKIFAGFDDTMTHIPVIANTTRTKKGRIAFAFGIFLAISLVIGLAFIFASSIRSVPHVNYISAGLIFLIAVSVYFDLFVQRPKQEIRKKIKNIHIISTTRLLKLIGIGFLTAFATIIDDTVAYSGLFLSNPMNSFSVIFGIFLGTILQLTIVAVQIAHHFLNLDKALPDRRG